ncbi:hypothetical protein SLEP1_g27692 [Rubroshorea leprosula]|uniref:Uncharacterized protein n=1 Tax=Rubroshorea leprosula TaxID=152421 RepID=A0AAV5K1Z9_9ROSI|nr:hypothetical protein SLEP1_g27692 [Rubroshorea leprosula]
MVLKSEYQSRLYVLQPAVQENKMCNKPAKLVLCFAASSTEKTECVESRKAGYRNGKLAIQT